MNKEKILRFREATKKILMAVPLRPNAPPPELNGSRIFFLYKIAGNEF